jgi:transposase InsO family protein
LDRWAYGCGVDLKLIAAGKPTQNAYIESFNGKFRDECLNDHYFHNLEHARIVMRHGGAIKTRRGHTVVSAASRPPSSLHAIARTRTTPLNCGSFNLAIRTLRTSRW